MDKHSLRNRLIILLLIGLMGMTGCNKKEPKRETVQQEVPVKQALAKTPRQKNTTKDIPAAQASASQPTQPTKEKQLAEDLFSMMKQAELQNSQGKFEDSYRTWNRIHEQVSRIYGLDGWQTISAEMAMAAARERTRMTPAEQELASELAKLITSASAAIDNRNFNEAKLDIEKATGISVRLWGKESYVTANVNFTRARCYLALESYQRAIAVLNDVLNVRISLTGLEHPDVETTLDLLAKANNNIRDYAMAQQALEKLVKVSLNLWGKENEIYASRCNELAVSYNNNQQPNLALPWFDKALAVRKSLYGDDSLPVGHVLLNRGISRVQQKEFEAAQTDLGRALVHFKKRKLPEQDPAWALLLDQLGTIALLQKENADAQKHFSELADYWQKKEGISHLEYGKSLYKLSVSIGNQGRYNDAEPIMKQAITIFESQLGYNNKLLRQPLSTYARLLEKMGIEPEAKKIKDRAVRMAGFQELPE